MPDEHPSSALPLHDLEPPRDDSWQRPTMIATLVALVVMVITLIIVNASQDRTTKDAARTAARSAATTAAARATLELRKAQAVGCNRTQLRVALDSIAVAQGSPAFARLYQAYTPILDCEQTYLHNGGVGVPLPPDLAACFKRLVGTSERNAYFLTHPVTSRPDELGKLCKGGA